MKRANALLAALAAAMLSIIAIGARAGHPVMDDGELWTTFREAGISAIATSNRDRPLNGWLIQQSVRCFGEHTGFWVATSVLLWALLAWQTARLFRRLFPDAGALAGLAAILVLAPIVVEMQYTTLTFVYAAIVPVSLSLEGLLVVLARDGAPGRPALILGMALVAAGALVSEYAIATMAAGLALLLVLRQGRGAAFLLLGGILGSAAFRWLADATARVDTMPSVQIERVAGHLERVPLRWMSGLWYSLVGAYGSAAGAAKIDVTSMSTSAAALFGLAAAVAAFLALRRRASQQTEGRQRELVGLLLAVGAGLVPVAAALRVIDAGDFASRFRLPILPFAAVASVVLLNRIVASRWRVAANTVLAFVAGYAVVLGAVRTARQQRIYDDLGRTLLPLARASSGLTVAVVSDTFYGVPWAKLTRRWSIEDERRAWAMTEGNALHMFGTRAACHGIERLQVEPTLRTIGREGPISSLVWVLGQGDRTEIEPYCATPRP